MRRRAFLASLCLAAAGCAGPARVPPPRREAAGAGVPVRAVIDGDTVDLPAGRVRLDGIDAPERGQPHGRESAAALRDLIAGGGGRVTVSVEGTDRYGRTIARLGLPGGVDVSEAMVERGAAWWYRRYSDDPRLAAAERRARRAGRGLWAGAPVPPWEWRSGRRA